MALPTDTIATVILTFIQDYPIRTLMMGRIDELIPNFPDYRSGNYGVGVFNQLELLY